MPGIGSYFKFLLMLGSDTQFFHQAFHSFPATADATFEQVAVDTRTAIITPAPMIDR